LVEVDLLLNVFVGDPAVVDEDDALGAVRPPELVSGKLGGVARLALTGSAPGAHVVGDQHNQVAGEQPGDDPMGVPARNPNHPGHDAEQAEAKTGLQPAIAKQ
jgi:hypothetical protein